MYKESKHFIKCPLCNKIVEQFQHYHYVCDCGWDSLENTVDIYSGDPSSSSLSNLFPHEFTFHRPGVLDDYVKCLSMESFIQSLRVKDWDLQKKICSSYFGLHAWRLKFALPDWRQDGIVYWHNEAIDRHSDKYTDLITQAYDCLFETNDVFRKLVLPSFKGKILIHSIGKDSQNETLLTELEYRAQLNRLMKRLDELETSPVQIYTSSYSNAKCKTRVSISGDKGKSVNFVGPAYTLLAPKKDFWQVWHDNIDKDNEDPNNLYYMKAFYKEVLSHLDPNSVIQDLKLHGNPVTILCYEESNEFCHRHLVATWLERKLGIKIPEVAIDASGKITEIPRNPKYVEQFSHILDIYDK